MVRRRARALVRWVLILAVVGALGFGGLWLYRQFFRPTVTVTKVERGPVVQAFYATGTVQPRREYPIRSNVAGILTQVHKDKGDRVSRNEPIAVVKVDELEYRHAQAKADYELKLAQADPKTSPVLQEFDFRIQGKQAELAIEERELKRRRDLLEKGGAALAEVDAQERIVADLRALVGSLRQQRENARLNLEKALKEAKAALDIAQWNLDQQVIRSPIDGVVLERPVPTGTRVAVNDEITRVAKVDPMALVMRAEVDEEDRAKLRRDMPVLMSLYSYPGRPVLGRVAHIYPKADEVRRTFEVDVEFEQWLSVPVLGPVKWRVAAVSTAPESLSAGMSGELAFLMRHRENATVVPSQAIQDGAAWVVRDGKVRRVDVSVGLVSVERTEIKAGLKPGEVVVISTVRDLSSGQQVNTQYVDPASAAGLNRKDQEQAIKAFN